MKNLIIGSALAALLAGSALAQTAPAAPPPPPAAPGAKMPGRHMPGMMLPETRAQLQEQVKAHFAEADTNKDGAITREETEALQLRKAAEMRDHMFDMIDANKDGQISRDEFKAHHDGMKDDMKGGMMGHMGHDMPPSLPGAKVERKVIVKQRGEDPFTAADANKDGKVTLAEANAKALAAFDKADANKDGTLSADERKAMMKTVVRKKVVEKK